MRSHWARLQLLRVPLLWRKDPWETESALLIIQAPIPFSSNANKMPAVHHKLLLEDALQDSPQVGLRRLYHIYRPRLLHLKAVRELKLAY